jgi:hypothetical protein
MLHRHRAVALVNTCVPGIAGEDLTGALADLPVTVVDAPGFLGGVWAGHASAIAALRPVVEEECIGVGIDGLSPLDPFARGNLHECERLLRLAGASPAVRYAGGPVASLSRAAPVSVVANPAFAAGPGERAGDLLGLDAVLATFDLLSDRDDRIDTGAIEAECAMADERCVRACDKYLRSNDPPRAAFFGEGAYVAAAARLLDRYLGAECLVLGYRDAVPPGVKWETVRADDLGSAEEILNRTQPDLILGSSFEQRLRPGAAFVPVAPPIRGRWRLAAMPFVGVEGVLALVEAVLNACAEARKK